MTNDFLLSANKTLNSIFDLVNSFNYDLEIDFLDNNITIEIDDDRIFVISIHEPSKQIWLSSPLSGAHHFSYSNELKKWISTRNSDIELFSIVESEIKNIMNDDD